MQVLDEIRITIEGIHLFYLKAVKNDGHTDQWKYDIIFMIEPSPLTITENEQQVLHLEDSSCTPGKQVSTPQQLPSTVKQMLFESSQVSTSNKRQTEEHHDTNENEILKSVGATP
ncbi:Uncharacterized protein Fot_03961 [Forsythia ovata]|uniref:Uncharacterized protein n=1 Tax=Forsythia ovata TaxID=205694 RepID=A0ABD1XB92_9LAMI